MSIKRILNGVEQRAKQRPDWARSDYARKELGKMGHHVDRFVTVHSHYRPAVEAAYAEATRLFGKLVSPILSGTHDAHGFTVWSCGSDVGYETEEQHDENIDELLEWLGAYRKPTTVGVSYNPLRWHCVDVDPDDGPDLVEIGHPAGEEYEMGPDDIESVEKLVKAKAKILAALDAAAYLCRRRDVGDIDLPRGPYIDVGSLAEQAMLALGVEPTKFEEGEKWAYGGAEEDEEDEDEEEYE